MAILQPSLLCGSFSFLLKRAIQLKEVQIVKPSDTHWLAHERYVNAVKAI